MSSYKLRCLVAGSLLLSVSVATAADARTAATFEEAKNLAKNQPGDILVLVTGSDWHPGSMTFLEQVFQAPEFRSTLGPDVILVRVDHLAKPGENQEKPSKANDLQRYLFQVPLLGLYDSRGRDFGQLTDRLEGATPQDVAQRVRDLIALRRERDELWQQAQAKEGRERAELIGQGLAAINVGWGIHEGYRPRKDHYNDAIDEIEKLDPKDLSGWNARFQFNPYDVLGDAVALAGEGKHEQGLALVDKALKNEALSTEYRQRLLAAKFAVYKRWPNHEQQILNVLQEIEQLDSGSLMGMGARGYAEYFTGPVDLKYGWRPHHVGKDPQTWTLDVTTSVTAAGVYRLKLQRQWNIGRNGIVVRSMAVEMGGEVVWRNDKERKPEIIELIDLPACAGRTAVLKIEARGDGGADSAGAISLEPYYIPVADEAALSSTTKPAE